MNIIYSEDTIAAISTAFGKAGVAVIRVSGKDSFSVIDEFFKGKISVVNQKPNTIQYGKIFDDGNLVDDVVVTKFENPHSYTGEDVIEISCHGNDFIANMILELLLRKVRLANAGEFTMRAFFNDKLDLTQAEAVGDLLNAKTKHQHQMAIYQLEGSLQKKIKKILSQITELRTLLELEIDFQEQGLTDLDENGFINNLNRIISKLQKLLQDGDDGIILRDGYKVSLVGSPNVGKSSIFNKLLENERAIVTPIPGTTRDYIEEAIALDGFLIRFFDTAGIRETSDNIEKIGIERAINIIKSSHKILFIEDGTNSSNYKELVSFVDEDKIIKILNKSDIHNSKTIEMFKENGYIISSTETENGLDEIKDTLLSEINISNNEISSGLLTNMRQISAVKKSLVSLQNGLKAFKNQMGIEFVAFDLQEGSSFLEELIGKVSDEDIRTKIFSEFCVGK